MPPEPRDDARPALDEATHRINARNGFDMPAKAALKLFELLDAERSIRAKNLEIKQNLAAQAATLFRDLAAERKRREQAEAERAVFTEEHTKLIKAVNDVIGDARNQIRELKSQLNNVTNGWTWVSVKDRLPEINKRVLIWRHEFTNTIPSMASLFGSLVLTSGTFWWKTDGIVDVAFEEISHWCEIVPPPVVAATGKTA